MQKEFLTYEQALALKELGFNEGCMAGYQLGLATLFSEIPHTMNGNIHKNSEGITAAPLKQQAFKFFRDNYPYRFYILPCSQHKKYLFEITLPSSIFYTSVEDEAYNTHEEAEDACLDKLIEIVKSFKK